MNVKQGDRVKARFNPYTDENSNDWSPSLSGDIEQVEYNAKNEVVAIVVDSCRYSAEHYQRSAGQQNEIHYFDVGHGLVFEFTVV